MSMLQPVKMFSCNLNNDVNCLEPIQPCLPLNTGSCWTRGLLHDSELKTANDKMDDYFSTLFYENTADVYGYDFWNKSDDWKKLDDTERINFYNKQNLISSGGSERLYERNVEMDKLIAKFDTNVEDIWKSSSETDTQYQNLLSQNFFSNPYINCESDFIWSFEQKEKGTKNSGLKLKENNYKSHLNIQNGHSDLDTVLSAFNATLSNIQNWSTMDTCNSSNYFTGKNLNDFSDVAYSKSMDGNSNINTVYNHKTPESFENSNEDEDLLTSTKTHFRPIRAEEFGSSQTGTYADGTTFPISNDLEKVSFRRSESGLLYLEADADTPRKYMEFKEKEGLGNKGDWDGDASPSEEFIPKFCLRQSNEKCIQTDEIEEERVTAAENETDCDSVSCKSEDDQFYFPGDEELVQNIINAMEEESTKEENTENNGKLDILEMSLCEMTELKPCVCGGEKDWNQNSIAVPKEAEWSQIWKNQKSCERCRSNSEKLSLNDKYRLREELTEEGEQLMLDLKCLQQMYLNSDWFEDDDDDDDDYGDDSVSTSDFNDEDAGLTVEDVIGGPGKGPWWSTLIAKQEPVKNGFDLRCIWKEETLFSDSSKNEKNNRIGKDGERKRRNSSSQKACNLYLEGQSRRPHGRLSHVGSIVSCFRGEPCTVFNGSRRPLSL